MICSYTSSVTTYASYFFASSPIYRSSSLVKTFPQGLDGLQTIIAFNSLFKCILQNRTVKVELRRNQGVHKSDWRWIEWRQPCNFSSKMGKIQLHYPLVTYGHHRALSSPSERRRSRRSSLSGSIARADGVAMLFAEASRKFSAPNVILYWWRPFHGGPCQSIGNLFGGSKVRKSL